MSHTSHTSQSDLAIPAIRRALSGGVIGSRIHHYDALGSTMDEARRLSQLGAPEGAVVIAEEQTAGRGRFNRAWVSPRGENLSFSVILTPPAAQLPYMNMAAALAVARMLRDEADLRPTIKWPNDIRVGGRKIAGILIETGISPAGGVCAIVGIGVNINFDPALHPEIAAISTSVYRETHIKRNRAPALQTLLAHFDAAYARLRLGHAAPIAAEWSALLDTLGHSVTLRRGDDLIHGIAERVDPRGNLLIRLPDGSLHTAAAGEVTSQT